MTPARRLEAVEALLDADAAEARRRALSAVMAELTTAELRRAVEELTAYTETGRRPSSWVLGLLEKLHHVAR